MKQKRFLPILIFIILLTLCFIIYLVYTNTKLGLFQEETLDGRQIQNKLVDLALVKDDINLCNNAQPYTEDHQDYGYIFTKDQSIQVCRSMFYGIKGDKKSCDNLSHEDFKTRCNYYIYHYPKDKETCMKLWSTIKGIDSFSFCEKSINKCPLRYDSLYCKNNNLIWY